MQNNFSFGRDDEKVIEKYFPDFFMKLCKFTKLFFKLRCTLDNFLTYTFLCVETAQNFVTFRHVLRTMFRHYVSKRFTYIVTVAMNTKHQRIRDIVETQPRNWVLKATPFSTWDVLFAVQNLVCRSTLTRFST